MSLSNSAASNTERTRCRARFAVSGADANIGVSASYQILLRDFVDESVAELVEDRLQAREPLRLVLFVAKFRAGGLVVTLGVDAQRVRRAPVLALRGPSFASRSITSGSRPARTSSMWSSRHFRASCNVTCGYSPPTLPD